MKKTMVAGLLVLFACLHVPVKTEAQQKKATQTKASLKKKKISLSTDPVILSNNSSSAAFAPLAPAKFDIADTTIKTFNARAAGENVKLSSSGIAGMPKGSYGFANGRLFLRNTTAASSGGLSGSGAVGTGTSIQGVGTSEATIGVNGKNPYAGVGMWGDKQQANVAPQNTQPVKKD